MVDEQGNEYEATYPKRAKGLVKNGRARFVGENKICLACPPDINNKYTEDDIMETVIENNIETPVLPEKVTVEYILGKIEQLQTETEQFYSKFSAEHITTNGDDSLSTIGYLVKCHETTNQKLLEFYNKVYDDIKPVSKADALKWIKECIGETGPAVPHPDFTTIIKELNSF